MSNRFVRSSKFRHVFGTAAKKENCYDSIRVTKSPNESNMCSVNGKFFAVVLEAQGGGAFLVCPLSRVGRFDINYPKVSGHKGPVLDIAWNPFDDNEIASCSEDCTIMLWNIPDGGITEDLTADAALCKLQGHQKKVNFLAWHPSASDVLLSVGADNAIIVWNTKTQEQIAHLKTQHPDAIQSVSWNYDGSYIATTCKDKKIRVLDPRNKEEPIFAESSGAGHAGTKPAHVVFCGTMNRLFTTGFTKSSERQYALWDPADLSKPLHIENIDVSSGVLFPFWDEGTNMVYIVGKGDTTIKYFEVCPEKAFFLSMYQASKPQRSVAPMPKRELDYMKHEVMRFFRVLPMSGAAGYVEPISMTVPRKSDMFQDDIFPPCPSGKPAMSAADWASGTNKDPLLVRFSGDGLTEMPEAECKKSTPLKKKGSASGKEAPSVLKRLGSPQPGDASARAPPVSLAEYKTAYQELLSENERLRKKLAELEGKK